MPAHTHATLGNTNIGGSQFSHEGSNSAQSKDTESTGGGGAHNNIQPSLVLYGIIRAI